MLSDFSAETGGTLLAPGSHRMSYNPTSGRVDAMASFPFEINGTGRAGNVLMIDSRVWHATAPNTSPDPWVAVALRFAPWWLSTDVLRPGSAARALMVDGAGASENLVPVMEPEPYEAIPGDLKPL